MNTSPSCARGVGHWNAGYDEAADEVALKVIFGNNVTETMSILGFRKNITTNSMLIGVPASRMISTTSIMTFVRTIEACETKRSLGSMFSLVATENAKTIVAVTFGIQVDSVVVVVVDDGDDDGDDEDDDGDDDGGGGGDLMMRMLKLKMKMKTTIMISMVMLRLMLMLMMMLMMMMMRTMMMVMLLLMTMMMMMMTIGDVMYSCQQPSQHMSGSPKYNF